MWEFQELYETPGVNQETCLGLDLFSLPCSSLLAVPAAQCAEVPCQHFVSCQPPLRRWEKAAFGAGQSLSQKTRVGVLLSVL